jgi:hypothetical protein
MGSQYNVNIVCKITECILQSHTRARTRASRPLALARHWPAAEASLCAVIGTFSRAAIGYFRSEFVAKIVRLVWRPVRCTRIVVVILIIDGIYCGHFSRITASRILITSRVVNFNSDYTTYLVKYQQAKDYMRTILTCRQMNIRAKLSYSITYFDVCFTIQSFLHEQILTGFYSKYVIILYCAYGLYLIYRFISNRNYATTFESIQSNTEIYLFRACCARWSLCHCSLLIVERVLIKINCRSLKTLKDDGRRTLAIQPKVTNIGHANVCRSHPAIIFLLTLIVSL